MGVGVTAYYQTFLATTFQSFVGRCGLHSCNM